MKKILAGIALLGTAASAQAADMAVKAPYLKAPVAMVYDWTGFYVGGHVGYSRGTARASVVDDDTANFTHSFGSLIGGLHGGHRARNRLVSALNFFHAGLNARRR